MPGSSSAVTVSPKETLERAGTLKQHELARAGSEHVPAGRRDDGGELVALANGCICCSLREDLQRAVAGLAAQRRFDHVLIEATGAQPGSRSTVVSQCPASGALAGSDSCSWGLRSNSPALSVLAKQCFQGHEAALAACPASFLLHAPKGCTKGLRMVLFSHTAGHHPLTQALALQASQS